VYEKHCNTVEPSYNDIGLCKHLFYCVSHSVVPINSSLLTTKLHTSVITTLLYNDTESPLVTL